MNTKLSFYIIGFCLLFHCASNAQDNFQFGLLPVLNINKKIGEGFRLNFKTEAREVLYRESDFDFQHELTDFSLILSRKTGLNNSIAAGYLLRFRGGKTFHRTIQQFTITRKYPSFRLAHRFSSDQTFTESESMEFRVRYRISGQFPLNGQSLDAKEFYLKTNNEYLNSFEEDDYDLEIRLNLILGFEFNDNSKVELGIDQRFDSFLEDQLRMKSWLIMAWYYSW